MSAPSGFRSPPCALATPPSSDIDECERHAVLLPASPPRSPKRTSLSAVDHIVGILRLRKDGKFHPGESDWRTFELTPSELRQVEWSVQHDASLASWYEDKCRCDYDPLACAYTLRMPSAVHERFIASVEDEIARQIAMLAEKVQKRHDGWAAELRRIYKGRSTTLELHAPRLENSSQESTASTGEERVVVKRSPDATFYHPAAPELPALVLEVSYSQQRKSLPRLAESYIVDSQHAIRCVVGLDIPYSTAKGKMKRDKTAMVSISRPGTERDGDGEEIGVCTHDTEAVFRDGDGEACTGAMELYLADMLPTTILHVSELDRPDCAISIPFTDLTRFLAEAEATARATATATSPDSTSPSTPKKFRKRQRQRTPIEELCDGCEQEYLRQERVELEQNRLVDGEWRSPKSGRVVSRGEKHELEAVERRRRRSLRRRRTGRAAGAGS